MSLRVQSAARRQCPLAHSGETSIMAESCVGNVFCLHLRCWHWGSQSFLCARTEPKYYGRTLTQWFEAARADGADATVVAERNTAVYVLGTNSLQRITRHVSFDVKQCFPQKVINVLPGTITPRWLLEHLLDRKRKLNAEATDSMEVFRILGSQGAPAIPELTEIALHGPFAPAGRAVDCLGYIGEAAIPALIMVTTNSQPQSIPAFGWLADFTNSPEAQQIAMQFSQDPNFRILSGAYMRIYLTNVVAPYR